MSIARLSRQDYHALMEISNRSLECVDEVNFRRMLRNLQGLIPYDFAICGLARINDRTRIHSYEVLNISYPDAWIEHYIGHKYHKIDPVFRLNFIKFGLQYWSDSYRLIPPPRKFVYEAAEFGLKRGCTYGLRTFTGKLGSLFSFSGRSVEHNRRIEIIMHYIESVF